MSRKEVPRAGLLIERRGAKREGNLSEVGYSCQGDGRR